MKHQKYESHRVTRQSHPYQSPVSVRIWMLKRTFRQHKKFSSIRPLQRWQHASTRSQRNYG